MLWLLLLPTAFAEESAWPARDPAQPIVGRWEEYSANSVIDFFPDGTLHAYSPVAGATGRWRIDQNSILTLTMLVQGEQLTFQGKAAFIGEEEMEWALDEEGTVKHRRFEQPLPPGFRP
ncbi:MAG: hypothetical protein LBV45_00690 [Xanthomonadaceae bacterium]|nr:hypothetical protein [Xanthomonadaceae bacterium]